VRCRAIWAAGLGAHLRGADLELRSATFGWTSIRALLGPGSGEVVALFPGFALVRSDLDTPDCVLSQVLPELSVVEQHVIGPISVNFGDHSLIPFLIKELSFNSLVNTE